MRIVQPATQINTHAAGQKRPSIFGGRRFIHRKAAVRPIEWIVTQSAIRHQAMKSFESIDDLIKSSGQCEHEIEVVFRSNGFEAHAADEIVAKGLLE